MTEILQFEADVTDGSSIGPERVHEVLSTHILADGYDLVLDLQRSRGSRLVDARTGASYLDMFTFFASSALGFNHPDIADDSDLRAELAEAAINKPSNSDIYSVPQARFVDAFARVLGDPNLPHLFFIDGGALAVENALKTAFDWKSRYNEAHGIDSTLGTKVLHLEHAFHGRSGYTLSLTNTDPNKTARFPTFDWPRIPSPYVRPGVDIDALEDASLAAARAAFEAHPHDIACAIVEPIQGEGGDNHLRPRFLRGLRELCDEFDALLIFDEVQTGVGITGTAWAYQQLEVAPDIVSFGKKTQVCGIMAGRRVDEVPQNVFHVGSRINSTWGGNLTDMVRSRRILEIVERDGLIERAASNGNYLGELLTGLADRHPALENVRGRGLMRAVSLPDAQTRDRVTARLYRDEQVILLGCGDRSIRFRPALVATREDLDDAVAAVDRVLTAEGI